MIVQEEIKIAAPVAAADATLRRNGADGALEGIAAAAVAAGYAAANPGRPHPAEDLAVQLMASHPDRGERRYPMRWVVTAPGAEPFAMFEADLELHGDDDGGTRLLLTGSYVPPTGRDTPTLDRAALQQAASTTARTFLTGVADLAGTADPDRTGAATSR